jgi:hypothetical protein
LEGAIGRNEGKNSLRIGGRIADENIRERMAEAALTTDPLAVTPLVVVAVEVEAIAGGTEWIAGDVVAALQASERVFVNSVIAQLDGTQSLQVVVNEEENVVEPLTGIANHFTDLQMGKTAEQIIEARNGLQMVVAIGGNERAGDGPKSEDAIVDDVETSGFVAKVMGAAGRFVVVRAAIKRHVWSRLIGIDVENVGGFRVAWGNETAVLCTSMGVAVAAFLAIFLGGAGALTGRKETICALIAAMHPGAGFHQLAVGGDAHAASRRIAWKRRRRGDDAIGHQAQD